MVLNKGIKVFRDTWQNWIIELIQKYGSYKDKVNTKRYIGAYEYSQESLFMAK